MSNSLDNKAFASAVKASLSAARVGSYEAAIGSHEDAERLALQLYAWNAEVSSAFMHPLHICEVVIRNAVADALEGVYGPLWPWSPTFERSLPAPPRGYNSRQDLVSIRSNQPTTGKVIPELKFAFWQRLFTGRHDTRLWDHHLRRVMPHLDSSKTIAELRQSLFDDLEIIRKLRNRIAHHEPIFTRALLDDYVMIRSLISMRCPSTAIWLDGMQRVTTVIAAKP